MVHELKKGHLEIKENYAKGIRTVLKRLHTSPNLTNIQTYKKLNETAQDDGLRLNTIDDINENFLTQNITFLKQSKYFAEKGKDSNDEVKPLLFYYAEQTLFAFFVYSLFHYEESSEHHGLSMVWKKNGNVLKKPNLMIKKSGFFNRILDAYCLLTDRKFKFLPFVKSNSTIVKNDDKDSFLTHHELSLENIIKLRTEEYQPAGLESDLLDYLMLFYSSSLARYKPVMWMEIAKGRSELYQFNQSFSRFDILQGRLLKEICYIHNAGYSGMFLMMPDIQYNTPDNIGSY